MKQHGGLIRQAACAQQFAAPLVVGAIADHELDLVVPTQQLQFMEQVARCFTRSRGFHIHHACHAWVDGGHGHRAAGFQRYLVAGIAKPGQQWQTVRLRKRLATGYAHVCRTQAGDLLQNRIERHPRTAGKCIAGVAVLTPQRAASQPHECRGEAHGIALALQRAENLGDLEPRRGLTLAHRVH